jgi:uncharacterized protein YdeI (YjbR/CyaY-like superfamily)
VTVAPIFFPTPADLAAWFTEHADTESELFLGYWSSTWSVVNSARAADLAAQGRMRPAGAAAFEARRADRSGIYSFEQPEEPRLEDTAERVFRSEKVAWAFFVAQAPSYRRAAVWWVVSAKQQVTRDKRLARLVADSGAGRRLAHLSRP